jgi:hypothetical protein
MASRMILDREVWCPWSGFFVKGKKIKPHMIRVIVCANKTFFSMCTVCKARCFTSNWNLIADVMKEATVLEITEKPIVRKRSVK